MVTPDELRKGVKQNDIETVLAVFPDHYGRLMGKHFDAEYFVAHTFEHGAHSCNYLLTVDMEMEPVTGYKYANWESGYGDFHMVPDFTTMRMASWLEKTALVFCDLKENDSGEPVSISPRAILRRQTERAASLDYKANASSELEYYIFEDSYQSAMQKGYANLKPMGWYIEDYHMLQASRNEALHAEVRRQLKYSGVPVETSKGEWGIGQHEMNLRYSEVLAMADRHCICKQCLKEISDRLGLSVTFMAKFAEGQAGSSCHIHMSLWHDGKNVFPGDQTLGPVKASDVFRWFLGGWISHVPEVMVFYAPTVNAYKRYQSGSWAPTRLAWSHDNRTAGFRVVGSGQSLRIECRLPGADCNPYLAFAALLASGLDGIDNRIAPPEVFQGDMYVAESLQRVPGTLRDATDLFAVSEFARKAFGQDVVEHYSHFFRCEQQAYDTAVTDWERKRYFERI
jgi:glutamine synthetase